MLKLFDGLLSTLTKVSSRKAYFLWFTIEFNNKLDLSPKGKSGKDKQGID